jgi:hypothetical protein
MGDDRGNDIINKESDIQALIENARKQINDEPKEALIKSNRGFYQCILPVFAQ